LRKQAGIYRSTTKRARTDEKVVERKRTNMNIQARKRNREGGGKKKKKPEHIRKRERERSCVTSMHDGRKENKQTSKRTEEPPHISIYDTVTPPPSDEMIVPIIKSNDQSR
jgi:hypothetical protein